MSKKTVLNPKLRALKIKIKRQVLGIAEGVEYTSTQALEKASLAEANCNATHAFNPNKGTYLEARRNWLELAELLDEEEQVNAG